MDFRLFLGVFIPIILAFIMWLIFTSMIGFEETTKVFLAPLIAATLGVFLGVYFTVIEGSIQRKKAFINRMNALKSEMRSVSLRLQQHIESIAIKHKSFQTLNTFLLESLFVDDSTSNFGGTLLLPMIQATLTNLKAADGTIQEYHQLNSTNDYNRNLVLIKVVQAFIRVRVLEEFLKIDGHLSTSSVSERLESEINRFYIEGDKILKKMESANESKQSPDILEALINNKLQSFFNTIIFSK